MKFFCRFNLVMTVLLLGVTTLSNTVTAQTPVKETAPASQTPATQMVIQSGNFIATGEPTSGVAQMVKENGRYYLDLSEDFKTKSGPKLVVVLTNFFEPPKRLVPGTFIKLAKLQKIKGAQRYEIPSTVDPNTFHSVAIWCEPFNITFGHAMLVVPRRTGSR